MSTSPSSPESSYLRRLVDNKSWWAIIAVAVLSSLGTQLGQHGVAALTDYVKARLPITAEVFVQIVNKRDVSRRAQGATVTVVDPSSKTSLIERAVTDENGIVRQSLRLRAGIYQMEINYKYEGGEYRTVQPIEISGNKQHSVDFSPETWAQVGRDLPAGSQQGLQEVPGPIQIASGEIPAWLAVAYQEVGQTEIPGPPNNQRIMGYIRALGLKDMSGIQDDEFDWASAFVEWSLNQAGIKGPKNPAPIGWINWGRPLNEPVVGCVVVFAFGKFDHVGFYVGEDEKFINVLGGNQSDTVKVSRYPKIHVLGYRMPS